MRTAQCSLQLVVRTTSARSLRGVLQMGAVKIACSLGRSGLRVRKREGDGATPIGVWGIVGVFYRADRVRRPWTRLPVRALRPDDGWCDAASDRNYNRLVRHPYPASAERLWREDGLYDMIVVLDHNQRPRLRGAGSAIFLHCAREGFAPTEGCIAVRRADLMRVLRGVGRGARVRVPV